MSDLFDSSSDLQTGPGTSTGEHVVYLVILRITSGGLFIQK